MPLKQIRQRRVKRMFLQIPAHAEEQVHISENEKVGEHT